LLCQRSKPYAYPHIWAIKGAIRTRLTSEPVPDALR
jgi:hypothetical protein